MTGTPFTVFDGNDFSVQGSAPGNQRILLQPAKRGRQIPTTVRRLPVHGSTRMRSSESRRTPTLRCSNSARPAATSPRGRDTRIGTSHCSRISGSTESKELQFRAEFFNILNHTNFRHSRQRHELANFQPDSGGPAAPVDPVGVEIYVLVGRGGPDWSRPASQPAGHTVQTVCIAVSRLVLVVSYYWCAQTGDDIFPAMSNCPRSMHQPLVAIRAGSHLVIHFRRMTWPEPWNRRVEQLRSRPGRCHIPRRM